MSICRRLAEAMGGGISVVSRPGEGSRFIVTLDQVRWFESMPPESTVAETAASALQGAERLSVLVVDDVPMNIMVHRTMLEHLGVGDVASATNGAEALELLRREPDRFDVVLSDVRMPGMGCLELLARIRADARLDAVRVFAVTADVVFTQSADAAGLDGVLLKPVTLGRMRDLINGIIGE